MPLLFLLSLRQTVCDNMNEYKKVSVYVRKRIGVSSCGCDEKKNAADRDRGKKS